MFSWAKPISSSSEGFNPEDYTFEGDGGLLAFEEAFHDIALINEKIAEANTEGVNRYAEAWHQGGQQAAMEAASAYVNGPVMEGVVGDAWESIKKAFKKLWAKIKAFFHSAIQYFDAYFKNARKFAEKYEDEIKNAKLDGFKYEMHRWNFTKLESINWKDVEQKAIDAAKKNNVVCEASGRINGWVDVLMEVLYYNADTKEYATSSVNAEPADGFSKDMTRSDINHFQDKTGWTSVPFSKATKMRGGSPSPGSPSPGSDPSKTSSVAKITTSQEKEVEKALINALGYGSTRGNLESFKKELMHDLMGSAEPKPLDNPVDDCLNYLKADDDLDRIKEWEDTMNTSFGEMEDSLNAADKEGDDQTKAKNKLKVFTIGKNVAMAMFKVYTEAVKKRQSECKGCLSAALHYKAPKA